MPPSQPFRERLGTWGPRDDIQIDSMDRDLQNGLWNCVTEIFEALPQSQISYSSSAGYRLIRAIWRNVKHEPVDEVDSSSGYRAYNQLKAYFMKSDWEEVYEILECIVEHLNSSLRDQFKKRCNYEMARHNGGYRFVTDELAPITSQGEIAEVEGAIQHSSDPVAEHLQTALEFLSDREQPNYRNSVKESISAVESAVGELTKPGLILSKGLAALKLDLHPALREAYGKIYGYAGDEGGIRHSLNDESREVTQEEARYMLISCSAFINYLRAVAARTK